MTLDTATPLQIELPNIAPVPSLDGAAFGESPCSHYIVDTCVCDDVGEPKGQCGNCGWPEEDHDRGSCSKLANRIATAILALPDGRMCHRIALKSGVYPHNERDEGGYCMSALVGLIREHLLDSGCFANVKDHALAERRLRPRLFLIRGVPGSGKTTYAKTLGISDHYEADMWFEKNGGYDPAKIKLAHQWCQKQAIAAMKAGRDVVVSNTFTRLWEMEPYKEAARKLGIKIIETVMTGNWNNVHGVPPSKVEEMRKRFEYANDALGQPSDGGGAPNVEESAPLKNAVGAESSPATLADALLKEIERCQELLTQYAAIGPAGNFGAMMIRQDIAAAHKAMMEGDIIAMLRAYKALKGCK